MPLDHDQIHQMLRESYKQYQSTRSLWADYNYWIEDQYMNLHNYALNPLDISAVQLVSSLLSSFGFSLDHFEISENDEYVSLAYLKHNGDALVTEKLCVYPIEQNSGHALFFAFLDMMAYLRQNGWV